MKRIGFPQFLGSALCLILPTAALCAGAASKHDLSGVVQDKSGAPVADASIFIYTAGPRHGEGALCPSCYDDCRKSTRSDAQGKFKIDDLDGSLLFQVLVVAKNCAPKFANKVDPAKGPLTVAVVSRPGTNLPPERTIFGRVVDANKKPVPWAVVSVEGTKIGNTTHGFPPGGTDPMTVADEKGEFFLTSQKGFDAMELRIRAAGLARRTFPEALPGAQRREFVLTEGAYLAGRLLRDGKPLGNGSVGMVSVDRSMGKFTGDFVAGTKENGEFLFMNLPPNREYFFYAMMDSVRECGAVRARKVRLGDDGKTTEIGDVAVSPGRRLAGTVKLSDGKPLPEHTRLMINREEAWDNLLIELPADGKFDLRNLPAESLGVSAAVKGYRISAQNASLDRLNPFGLVGRLDSDKTNLTILLEPGERLPSEFDHLVQAEMPQNLPLLGIEAKRTMADPWRISGRVIDADTKEPVAAFHLTPGRKEIPQSYTQWQKARGGDFTNGTFSLELSRQGGMVVLMVEAEGYLPALSELLNPGRNQRVEAEGHLPPLSEFLNSGRNQCDVQLKKGHGPHGSLLFPDGKPADGVSVYYIGPQEQGHLSADGKFSVYKFQGNPAQTLTDPDGAFDFAPKFPGGEIIAAHKEGFVRVSAAELGENAKLSLQPWARVKGKLVKDGKPVAGEGVDLAWEEKGRSHVNSPSINLYGGLKTREDGSFAFDHVPPGNLQLTTRVPFGEGQGWTTQAQKKFTAKPGADLDLGEINKTESSLREASLNR